MLDFWRKLRRISPTKSSISGVNKIKRDFHLFLLRSCCAVIVKKGGAKNTSAKIRLLIFTDHFALQIETHFLRSRKLRQSICSSLHSLKIYAIVFQGAIFNFGRILNHEIKFIIPFWPWDCWVLFANWNARILLEASQKITDKISFSGENKIKRIGARFLIKPKFAL